jgi:hypothetical protein
MSTPPEPPDTPMHISEAPRRVQREHYRRERRNSIIAVTVLAVIAGLVIWGIVKLVRLFTD